MESVDGVTLEERKKRLGEFVASVLFWLGLIAGIGGWAFDSMKSIGLGVVLELGSIALLLDIVKDLRKGP